MRITSASVVNWEQAAAAGASAVGGKGWNLGRLHRYGFRVPKGGVVTAAVYDALMADPQITSLRTELESVSPEQVSDDTVVAQLAHLREVIVSTPFPGNFSADLQSFLEDYNLTDALLAVRSSATAEDSQTASFAGIHESFLNVQGFLEIEAAIKACYASLWTPRALAYRRRLGFADDEVRCAVVLCEMVGSKGPQGAEPKCAGVAFSCDPLTGNREHITISAVSGLGEALVSGAANPEELVVRLSATGPYEVVERRSPGSPILSDEAAVELARQVVRVLWALGDGQDPQDIEWAYDDTGLWLVQARPVTQVARNVPDGAKSLPVIWSNGNLKDAVPIVLSTYGWSMMRQIISVNLFAPHSASGYVIPPGRESMRRFDGRPYFDLTLMAWIYYDSLGVPPSDLNRSLGGYQPEIQVPTDSPLSRNGRRRQAIRMRLWRVLREFDRRGEQTIQEVYTKLERWSQLDLRTFSDRELLSHLRGVMDEGVAFSPNSMFANSSAGIWHQMLETVLEKVAKGRGKALTASLMAGGGGVVSAEHGFRLYDLARVAQNDEVALAYLQSDPFDPLGWENLPSTSRFRTEFEAFLKEYGHRGVYEVDVMNPRWSEDPTYLLDQIRSIVAMGEVPDPKQEAQRKRLDAEAEVASRTRLVRPLIKWLARRLRHSFALREACKSALVAFLAPTRSALLEVGRRLVSDGKLEQVEDIFFLSGIDVEMLLLGAWDGTGSQHLVADRKTQHQEWLVQTPPDVFIEGADGKLRAWDGEPLPGVVGNAAMRPKASFDGERLVGMPVSSGTAHGRVRVLRHPNEGHRLRRGEILVAPSTDPGWTPLFLRAAAVVMEVGGYHSHGAIVSREYGLPAVVNIPGLLDALHDGDEVVVDGDQGTVAVLKRAAELASGM